jgi:hypothetical protein
MGTSSAAVPTWRTLPASARKLAASTTALATQVSDHAIKAMWRRFNGVSNIDRSRWLMAGEW